MADSRSPKGRDSRGTSRPGARAPKARGQRPTDSSQLDSTQQFSMADSFDIPATERTNPRGEPVTGEQPKTRAGVVPGLLAGARRAFSSRPADPLVTGPGSARIRSLLDARSRSDRPRARFTARMAVLVLVLAVLTVMAASSLRAYVQQRDHLQELKAGNEALATANAAMTAEKSRWEDPAYVQTQAREQLGYLFPGERGFKIVGLDSQSESPTDTLPEPSAIKKKTHPWWDDAWASVELAGNPPRVKKTTNPNDTINGNKPDVAEGTSKQ